jgi:Flp pilus assembly pilin Flp
MLKKFKRFWGESEGAVTVDWVVLCAAIVGLTVLISTAMTDNAVGLGDSLTLWMTNWEFE